jgi:hypothetical protein
VITATAIALAASLAGVSTSTASAAPQDAIVVAPTISLKNVGGLPKREGRHDSPRRRMIFTRLARG